MEELNEAQLKALKDKLFIKHQEAVSAAYAYFCACPIGDERVKAEQAYQNLRTATRI